MRVLIFSPVKPNFTGGTNGHNGGGWIESLVALLKSESDFDIGLVYEGADNKLIKNEGVSYFSINPYTTIRKKIKKSIVVEGEAEYTLPLCLDVITRFKPDIVHIFGSEAAYSLLPKHTSVPCVIHMQGSLPAYYNARFPVGVNILDIILSSTFSLRKKFFLLKNDHVFKKRSQREISVLQGCSFFMGRTDWDKSITGIYNKNSKYFHCDELLRNQFYENFDSWVYPKGKKLVISTTISTPLYKGGDLILKTAKLLKEFLKVDFIWNVYGVDDLKFFEKKYRISAEANNVNCKGVVSSTQLVDALKSTSLYVHPSYIDNSPNSVCEAQLIGVPTIAVNVGGLASIIKHNEDGFLVPANDPYQLAYLINTIMKDSPLLEAISKASTLKAMERHNPKVILKSITNIYHKVLTND